MYKRLIKKQIKARLFKGKVIIITGPRQTGKTTLSLDLLKEAGLETNSRIFNCDNPEDKELLNNKNLEFLVKLIGNAKVVFIDEGQKVETIGQTLKLLVDHYKAEKQILVTGSSSFNLLDKTEEPLTGRKFVYHLFPLSLEEIYPDRNLLKLRKELESYLIFGAYPDIVRQNSFSDKQDYLKELTSSYLYKDILEHERIKNSGVLSSLLKALALQIGAEVSYNELSNLIGIDKITIQRYVEILERAYIVFRLRPYTTRKRREIAKLKKIYFYDLGIRNAVINNFNFLSSRNDVGQLWENFLAVERTKFQNYHRLYSNNYFWRTYDGAEVDWVEERDGKLFGYEFKWNSKKFKRPPQGFLGYPESSYEIINPEKILDFVI